MKKHLIAAIVILVVVGSSYIAFALLTSNKPKEMDIWLRAADHDQRYVIVTVPKEYIGPPHLKLAQKLAHEGKTKIIPVAILLPDLAPWPENYQEVMKTSPEKMLYLMLMKMDEKGIRRHAGTYIQRATKTGDAFGLKAYAISSQEVVYYHKDEKIPYRDILIKCEKKRGINLCQFMISNDGHVWIEFERPQSELKQWKMITEKVRTFIGKFPVHQLDLTPYTDTEFRQPITKYLFEDLEDAKKGLDNAYAAVRLPSYYFTLGYRDGIPPYLVGEWFLASVYYPDMWSYGDPAREKTKDDIYLGIKWQPMHSTDWFTRKGITHQIMPDGSDVYYDIYEKRVLEKDILYDLTHYQMGSVDVYRKWDGAPEDNVFIKCQYTFCTLEVLYNTDDQLEIEFRHEHIAKWEALLQEARNFIDNARVKDNSITTN